MSRNLEGKLFSHSQQYHKAHLFEEIQEAYQIVCLTYGRSPIRFTRHNLGEHNQNSDYGLCADVIAAAKKVTDAGGGKIPFTATLEKEADDGRYSYRVHKDHNRDGSDGDSCERINRGADTYCGSI